MMYPSLGAQLGSHDRQMLRAAGVTPIETAIGRDWKCLEDVSSNMNPRMNPAILRTLKDTPGTYALCEGLCATGFIWWDGEWVWERWHWGRWPIARSRGDLGMVAFEIGVPASCWPSSPE